MQPKGKHVSAHMLCFLQVSELEAVRKREEGNLKALQKEHQQLKKEQFRASQALHALRQVGAQVQAVSLHDCLAA